MYNIDVEKLYGINNDNKKLFKYKYIGGSFYKEEDSVSLEESYFNDLEKLLSVLPSKITAVLKKKKLDDIVEVVLDIGRSGELRHLDKTIEYLSQDLITQQDIDYVISKIDDFTADNRSGIPGTLHRISAIRNRKGTPPPAKSTTTDAISCGRTNGLSSATISRLFPGRAARRTGARGAIRLLPGALWILIGVVLGGAVQDFVILFCSIRRNGKSLAQMVKEELNSPAGLIALLAILAILVIMLAVLALVVVKALAESPWGIFTVGATIPIALLMGCYLRFVRVGKVLEASAFGVALLLLAVWGGKLVYQSPHWSQFFGLHDITVAWIIIGYGVISSSLPVWLLLAPRDYLSTFMKLGTIFALAVGILLVLPKLNCPRSRSSSMAPASSSQANFPVLLHHNRLRSDFRFPHAHRQRHDAENHHARKLRAPIGYGAMCFESLVAIMALIAACTLDPGVYFSMNVKGDPAATVAQGHRARFSRDNRPYELAGR